MSIQIIADSGSDLPKDIVKEYDIEVIPLIVIRGEKEYLDGVTIDPKKLYDDMREGAVYKTAQVPFQTFKEVFTKYAKAKQSCIYIAFSSGLSGTYQAAELAKKEVLEEYPDFDLDIIDTKAASFGCGLMIYYAAQMVRSGRTKKQVVEAIKFYFQSMEHIFTVENLEYLFRGGRVSRTSAFVGGLLNIKPILNVEDGKLQPLEKIRGRKKVLKRIVDLMEERGVDLESQVIGISHSDDLETAENLKNQIEARFNCRDFVITEIGAVIGAHVGAGTLALFFLNKEIPENYK